MKNSFISIKLNKPMRILIVAILLVCVSVSAHSGRFSRAKLVYTDGSITEGVAMEPLYPQAKHITFRTHLKAEDKNIPSSVLSRVVYYEGADSIVFERLASIKMINRRKTKRPIWMIQLVEGYVSLYYFIYQNVHPIGFSSHGTASHVSFGTLHYACIRKDEPAATIVSMSVIGGLSINNNGRFRSKAPSYFENYPELSAKIRRREYTYKDIVHVVNRYNEQNQR